MENVILIPVKGFVTAKQRLSPVLSSSERSALASAMLEDIFDVLRRWDRRPQIFVVTSDELATNMARGHGFETIEDRECHGETEAISAATSVCIGLGATRTMVIPGDVPLVTAAELQTVLDDPATHRGSGSVLVPAADGRGTNAVLRRPADLFPLRFGNDSFQPHLRAAQAAGHPCSVLRLPGIGLDVDGPTDLAALLREPARTRSQLLLLSWKLPERLAERAQVHAIGAPLTS